MLIATAVDEGGEGDCFFFALYGAAEAKGWVERVMDMFDAHSPVVSVVSAVAGSPRSWEVISPYLHDRHRHKVEFMMCLRRRLGEWIRENPYDDSLSSLWAVIQVDGLIDEDEMPEMVHVRAKCFAGAGGEESLLRYSNRRQLRRFAGNLADSIQKRGTWVDSAILGIIYAHFLPRDDLMRPVDGAAGGRTTRPA